MLRLRQDEFWCRDCERLWSMDEAKRQEPDLFEDGGELVCPDCGQVAEDRVNESLLHRVEFERWIRDCHEQRLIGPSVGGAAAQLKVVRSRVYQLIADGVLERTDCPVPGYEVTMISQKSIDARKQHLALMEASGADRMSGGRPWH